MGKVKGQCDFLRMTWGHLSLAELMSCQCAVKGGGAFNEESPPPLDGAACSSRTGPACSSCTRPGGPGEHSPGGGPRRLWLASHPGTSLRGREPFVPAESHTELALLLFLDLEPFPQGLPLQGPFCPEPLVSLPPRSPTLRSLTADPSFTLGDTMRGPRREPLALTEGPPSQLVSCPRVRVTSCYRDWTPRAPCSGPRPHRATSSPHLGARSRGWPGPPGVVLVIEKPGVVGVCLAPAGGPSLRVFAEKLSLGGQSHSQDRPQQDGLGDVQAHASSVLQTALAVHPDPGSVCHLARIRMASVQESSG